MNITEIHTHDMVYGEAVQKEIDSMKMIKGQFIQTIVVKSKPKPMSFDLDGQGGSKGGRYYNEKLKKVWMKNMANNIPEKSKEKVVNYLMYGRTSA